MASSAHGFDSKPVYLDVSSNSDQEAANFNGMALAMLRKLNGAFPQRVNLLDCSTILKNQTDFARLWGWLEGLGIVSGPMTQSAITVPGRGAFQTALEQIPAVAGKLLQAQEKLDRDEANMMMLAVLRQYHAGKTGDINLSGSVN